MYGNTDRVDFHGCTCREEIRRLKTENPNMAHKEAFSTAAKNVRPLETNTSNMHVSILLPSIRKYQQLIK